MNFRVTPIDQNLSNEARISRRSPQYTSFPAFSGVATGYGPCRSCLKTFDEGNEDRLSFTYDSQQMNGGIRLPGPIFIHTEECDRYDGDGFPPMLRYLPLFFEAMDEQCELIVRDRAVPDEIEKQIEQLFTDLRVKRIKIRNAEAGCFVAWIDRN